MSLPKGIDSFEFGSYCFISLYGWKYIVVRISASPCSSLRALGVFLIEGICLELRSKIGGNNIKSMIMRIAGYNCYGHFKFAPSVSLLTVLTEWGISGKGYRFPDGEWLTGIVPGRVGRVTFLLLVQVAWHLCETQLPSEVSLASLRLRLGLN